ncbi:hypothetical protein ACTXT7_011715 [Hymenolepis weldensis]
MPNITDKNAPCRGAITTLSLFSVPVQITSSVLGVVLKPFQFVVIKTLSDLNYASRAFAVAAAVVFRKWTIKGALYFQANIKQGKVALSTMNEIEEYFWILIILILIVRNHLFLASSNRKDGNRAPMKEEVKEHFQEFELSLKSMRMPLKLPDLWCFRLRRKLKRFTLCRFTRCWAAKLK